jgi:UDP:flavonoid glycosyltransferase YjiC (YdhE family)
MRILCTGVPHPGHLIPVLPLARIPCAGRRRGRADPGIVLGQPRFRENALRVAAQIATMPAPSEVAETLASALK